MIQEVFTQNLTVAPSVCDFSGRLGWCDAFRLMMDIAAAHASSLSIGLYDLQKRDLFWLTAKTKVRFFAPRPAMGAPVSLATWPEKPARSRGNRSYELNDANGNLLVAGKTEWAILNQKNGKIESMAEIYPDSLKFERESALAESFSRISESEFSAAETLGEHRVSSMDTDIGGHMNNCAYLRALLGLFSAKELEAMKIRSLEAIYRASCFEGDLLKVEKALSADGFLDLRAKRGEETVFLLRIERG